MTLSSYEVEKKSPPEGMMPTTRFEWPAPPTGEQTPRDEKRRTTPVESPLR